VVLLAAVVDTRRLGFSPLATGYITPEPGAHQRLENRLLKTIPSNAVVAAADEIEPHLSDRYWVYKLPGVHPSNGPAAKYIVLDASIPSLPRPPSNLHAVAVEALRRGYGVVQAKDGVLILRRGARRKSLPSSFYSFAFSSGHYAPPQGARWGPLRLLGLTVHPRIGTVTRARPDIGVETYWRTDRRLGRATHIVFYLSPVYHGRHPRFSARWTEEPESPTWVWLPPNAWPVRRTVRAISLPLLPNPYKNGSVDVAIGVSGGGIVAGLKSSQRVAGAPQLIRVATIRVDAN
jgi:hypothetical protein